MKNIFFLAGIFLFSHSIIAQSPLNSLDFDGTNDYVTTTLPTVFNDIPNNDFTIEAWIKPTGVAFSRVVFAQLNASNFASISLGASNQIYFYVSNVTGMSTTTNLPIGIWSHVACTWDASTSLTEIYVNGILQATVSGGSSSVGTDNLMSIGARTNAAQFFQGELDEVRIWDLIRTQCEVSGSMNSEFTVAQPNLVAYYNFNQGVAGGSNVGINALPDFTTNFNGTLLNFGLTGLNSNWVTSAASVNSINQNNNFIAGVDTRTECNSLLWIDGNTYTSSNNTATHNIVGGAINGCDSLVTLNLTIINSVTGIDTRTECNSYTWIDGNTYTSSNNTATYNIVGGALNGCDSLVTLDLTINSITDISTTTSGLTISSNNSGASYQWLDCNNANAIIAGETGQTFTASTNGNYAVEITENGCVDTTACVAITTVGVLENSFGNKLVVFPNPTNEKFSIDLGKMYENAHILITDISGKLIESKTIKQSQVLFLSIKEPAGIYIISIQADNEKAVIRMVKE